jgi:hypothetical protein
MPIPRFSAPKYWLGATLLSALAGAACAPAHYSVSAARGPDHITFAQRNPEGHDYLVDCPVDPAGKPTSCSAVKLPSE